MEVHEYACSSPGKVLLAGGYLILDRQYDGIVYALNARIHVHVTSCETLDEARAQIVTVRSPQFLNAEWLYQIKVQKDGAGVQVIQMQRPGDKLQSNNHFIQTTLVYALTYAYAIGGRRGQETRITILADEDYYSRAKDISEAPEQSGGFVNFGVSLDDAHKTGLGSSAALVTSLSAAIVTCLAGPQSQILDTTDAHTRIHRLAQAAHCAAQGKIGSGFDVAAAVYGSCIYRRFSPSVLESVGQSGTAGFEYRVRSNVEGTEPATTWDAHLSTDGMRLIDGIRLVMCDVDCGTETVGMVKKMLTWRQQRGDQASQLWDELHAANGRLFQQIRGPTSPKTSPVSSFADIISAIMQVRALLQKLSKLSGVPVEPPEQTDFIDACSTVPGVLGGLVPGAGGYDAIVLILEDKQEVLSALQDFVQVYQLQDNNRVSGKRCLLNVRQETEGLRAEKCSFYQGWL